MRLSFAFALLSKFVAAQSISCEEQETRSPAEMSSIVQTYPPLMVASSKLQSQISQLDVASAQPMQASPTSRYTPSASLSASLMPSASPVAPLSLSDVTHGSNFTLRFADDRLGNGAYLAVSEFLFDSGSKSSLWLSAGESKHFYMNESWLMTRDSVQSNLYGIRLKDPWQRQEVPLLRLQRTYSMGAWLNPQAPSPPWGKFQIDWSGPKGILLMEPLPLPLQSIAFESWVACSGPGGGSTVLVAKFEGVELQDPLCRLLGNCTLERA